MTKAKRQYTKRSVGKRSKDKGRSFENDVAKLLTKWSGLTWRRVPQSGGWNKRVVTGDVFCEDEYTSVPGRKVELFIPFSWECKKQEGWSFTQLFSDSEKCPLRLFWTQASNDAKTIKKLPAMIFSRNYLPIFIMISTRTANRLVRLTAGSWHDFTHIIAPMVEEEQVVVFLLEDFLKWVPFKNLLELTV